MRWFWRRRAQQPQGTPLLDANRQRRVLSVLPRDISPLTETIEIETQLANAEAPFECFDGDADTTNIDRGTLVALREGCSMKNLIDNYPNDVLTVLKEVSVAPFGTMEAKDSQVLAAFGKEKMLTRGHLFPTDPNWETNWRSVLEEKAGKKANSNVAVGWEQNVQLGAYVVNLKDIARTQIKTPDFVDLLLQKYTSGAATREIWGYPAVQAVINYHWHHWARRLLMIVFTLFLLWTLCFSFYLFVYVVRTCLIITWWMQESSTGRSLKFSENAASHSRTVSSPSGSSDESAESSCPGSAPHSPWHPRLVKCCMRVLEYICFAAMCPFAIEEYWTVFSLGWQWLSVGNVLDMAAINLQAFIFVCRLERFGLLEHWFGYVLALQIVFLSLRLLRFVKLLGAGTTFLDTAMAVIYDVRYWLVYIVFTGVSASLALSAIYAADKCFHGKHTDFENNWASLVTTFQIIFGNFDTKFIFDAKLQYLIFFFYLGFQVLMTITVLNLIIATMADSYSKFANLKESQYYKARAELVAELSTLHLPKCMTFEPAPYVHFLIVEKKQSSKQDTNDASGSLIKDMDSSAVQEKLDTLTEKVDTMMSMVTSIVEKIGEEGRQMQED